MNKPPQLPARRGIEWVPVAVTLGVLFWSIILLAVGLLTVAAYQ